MDAVDYLRECVLAGKIDRDDMLHVVNGSRARLSELMAKKRAPSIEQIRRAHFDLGLDASKLLEPVTLQDHS